MPLKQDISSLNIPISQKKSLNKAGYYVVQDLCNNSDIVSSINIDKVTSPPQTNSALECFKDEQSRSSVQTFIGNLDALLNGIIKDGSVTELVGLPGSGRTLLCLHLSITGQVTTRGVSGETIYICTNLNLSISRLREIAEEYRSKCPIFKNIVIEDILRRIYHMSTNSFEEFSACLKYLEEFLKEHNSVKLVVIDSITYPLRQIDSTEKTSIMYSIIKRLRYLANFYKFSVVLTNDMTTVTQPENSSVVASLRDTFYHIINNRIKLSRISEIFHAEILKSSDIGPSKCDYQLFV